MIRRATRVVDKLVIGVLINSNKQGLFTPDERVEMLRKVTEDMENVEVVLFEGLLADFARKIGACVTIRGLRAITDFDYELQMAQTNHILNEELDTVFFATSVEYSFLSSSVIRAVGEFDGEIDKFVPACILDQVTKKCKKIRGEG